MKSKACTAVDLISCPNNALCSLLFAKYVLPILIYLILDSHSAWPSNKNHHNLLCLTNVAWFWNETQSHLQTLTPVFGTMKEMVNSEFVNICVSSDVLELLQNLGWRGMGQNWPQTCISVYYIIVRNFRLDNRKRFVMVLIWNGKKWMSFYNKGKEDYWPYR